MKEEKEDTVVRDLITCRRFADHSVLHVRLCLQTAFLMTSDMSSSPRNDVVGLHFLIFFDTLKYQDDLNLSKLSLES